MMLRTVVAKHVADLLRVQSARPSADKVAKAALPDAMRILNFEDADRMRLILKGIAEEVLKLAHDAHPDELVAWFADLEAKKEEYFAECDRRARDEI
jgi:hypothetical protein